MNATPYRRISALAVVTLVFGGCADGGGETGTGAGPARTPTETIHSGVITGFGSIFVNGIEFATQSSRITLDGTRGTEHDLAVGMIVTVRGNVDRTRSTGSASLVQYASEIDGVVLAASISAVSEKGGLNVMGRAVMVDEYTVFDSAVDSITSIAQVLPGSIVEISGHTSGASDIHATRVSLKSAVYDGREVEVKGVITNVMDEAFDLGTLHVSYALANTLMSGWYVEVRGTQGVASDTLIATRVTTLSKSGDKTAEGAAGERWTGQGVVTGPLNNNTFALSGVPVFISGSTRYVGGESTDITLDRRINVEGVIGTGGVIIANVVEIIPVAEFGMEAKVENIDESTAALALLGTVVYTNGATIFKDDRDRVRNFALVNIAPGDRLDLQFARTANGGLLATKVVRTPLSMESDELSGPFTSAGGQHSVAGIPVTFGACSPNCKPPPAGTDVELEGTWTGTEFSVESFEKPGS